MIINVQKMNIKFLHIYKKCTKKCTNWTKLVWTKSGLKLMYVFCTYKQWTNYTKPIKLANWNSLWCFLYIHTMCKLYKIYTNVNWIIYAAADMFFCILSSPTFLTFWILVINYNAFFHFILQLCKISGPNFSYSKRFN